MGLGSPPSISRLILCKVQTEMMGGILQHGVDMLKFYPPDKFRSIVDNINFLDCYTIAISVIDCSPPKSLVIITYLTNWHHLY